ncbi:hypothetical protein OAF54_00850 [bacterium]|nr:hypothetical protein [bacterium]
MAKKSVTKMPQRAPKRNRTKDGGGVPEVHKKVREAIKLKQIANRLEMNALGTLTNHLGDEIEMTAGQLKASEMLLRKALPDLSATTIENSDGSQILVPVLSITQSKLED